ncbi:Crp/Fnr family transcriptional regulator [Oricola indica]|jgi:CRP/FNR family transcriptional regulator|uniref:Crp/Fnr family transcriptional regulator n=1 Tax=Oricola indica TaxID=2872591 RepID=UPI001CBACD8F|nr:helix-turn-helix domain-containing protein [Oricola indica]
MNTARKDIHNSDIPAICRACEARHKGICGALTPEQLTKLNKYTKQYSYQSGNELLSAGEDVHRYSNILRGVVKLSKLLADGRQQIVGLQFAPDFMGRPFRDQSNVIADAATDVRVCSFPRSVMEDMIRESPDLEHKLHEQALDELDEARDWMLTLGRKSASEKVASFLFLIASHIDPEIDVHEGSIEFELPLKRSDIADFLGLTIETVSRQITKLRKAGVIQVENNRTVVVPDLERLRSACEIES